MRKETYNTRRKRLQETLIEWGIPKKILKKVINPPHKLGDLEKIIKATEKRKPSNPAEYFLKGVNYYREKNGQLPLYHSITTNKKELIKMEAIEKKIVYEGKYLKMVNKYFKTGQGKQHVWETVERKNIYGEGAVVIVALTKNREIILEKNWRVPLESFIIQFPAGLTDKKGETKEEAAKRELLEETGYRAEKLIPIISVPLCPALTATKATYFFAPVVEFAGKQKTENTEKIKVLKIPTEKIDDFLLNLPQDTEVDIRVLGMLWVLERKKLI
ncbi:MAG: NUDIX hydrolase [Deltaproteobacteria bacterium]|nr:NUDIX hydrolase [Deltaproteobacteria bacterium]